MKIFKHKNKHHKVKKDNYLSDKYLRIEKNIKFYQR